MDAKVPNVPAVQHERPAKPVTQPATTATSAGPPEAQMVQELLFDGCVLPPRSILGQLVRATARATASWLLPALGLQRTPTNVGCLMVRAASGCDSVAPKFCEALGHKPPPFVRAAGAAAGAGAAAAAPSAAPAFAPAPRRGVGQSLVRRAIGPAAAGLVARVQLFDAHLAAALGRGVDQVVVLAAGFDSSAYRFRGDFPGVKFFEVDLPHVSRRKQELVARCLPPGAMEGVSFVGADLAVTPLADALLPARFDRSKPAVWLAQGLFMYIPAAGVAALLRGARALSAPGSSLVFDAINAARVPWAGPPPAAAAAGGGRGLGAGVRDLFAFEAIKAMTDAVGETFYSCMYASPKAAGALAAALGFRSERVTLLHEAVARHVGTGAPAPSGVNVMLACFEWAAE